MDSVVSNEDIARLEALLERLEIEQAGLRVLREQIEGLAGAMDAIAEAVKEL